MEAILDVAAFCAPIMKMSGVILFYISNICYVYILIEFNILVLHD